MMGYVIMILCFLFPLEGFHLPDGVFTLGDAEKDNRNGWEWMDLEEWESSRLSFYDAGGYFNACRKEWDVFVRRVTALRDEVQCIWGGTNFEREERRKRNGERGKSKVVHTFMS